MDTRAQLDLPARRLTRRRVVAGAAWTAPAIVAATAVPAHAMSMPTPTITASWNGSSFRTTSDPNLASGTPVYNNGAQRGAIAVTVTVSGADVASLTCRLTTTGNGVVYSNAPAARGGTTWAANNADLAAQGWTATPAVSSTAAATSFSFARGATTVGTPVSLRFVVDQIGNGDLPFDFVFSAPGAAPVTVRATGSTTVSPFIDGTTL